MLVFMANRLIFNAVLVPFSHKGKLALSILKEHKGSGDLVPLQSWLRRRPSVTDAQADHM
jgi:hypothetical protein